MSQEAEVPVANVNAFRLVGGMARVILRMELGEQFVLLDCALTGRVE